FRQALDFVNKIGAVAEEEGHHPDLCLSWGRVDAITYTHKIKGLTESDFILAAKIDRVYFAKQLQLDTDDPYRQPDFLDFIDHYRPACRGLAGVAGQRPDRRMEGIRRRGRIPKDRLGDQVAYADQGRLRRTGGRRWPRLCHGLHTHA